VYADAGWNAGSFSLEMRRKPKLSFADPKKPLAGLKIMVDPGHSPKRVPPLDGAVGPMGYYEFEANLDIAKVLVPLLGSLGADVDMTRSGDEQVTLAERPRMAARAHSDLFISIHNNALGEGSDPLTGDKGFTVYFYQQHSMDLASHIHRAYKKNIPLPDEGMRYGDYHVVRLTQMPAVLIENAYMILPEQEALLLDSAFREKLAHSIAEGVLNCFGADFPKPHKPAKTRRAKKLAAAIASPAAPDTPK